MSFSRRPPPATPPLMCRRSQPEVYPTHDPNRLSDGLVLTGILVIFVSKALDLLWARMITVRGLYLLVRAPGIVIHECSHILGCLLTGKSEEYCTALKRGRFSHLLAISRPLPRRRRDQHRPALLHSSRPVRLHLDLLFVFRVQYPGTPARDRFCGCGEPHGVTDSRYVRSKPAVSFQSMVPRRTST